MENSPLVSIAVITYNSSKYVLETLESIKAQTYQNLELIVSDDCSTDNTVALCKDWIHSNQSRFVRTVLLESPVNTGVSGNGNRARNACNGEWIKGIAGDDLLMPHCIKTYIEYVERYPGTFFIFSRIKPFGVDEETIRVFETQVFDYSFFALSAKQQHDSLVYKGTCIPAPTFFYNSQRMKYLGVRNDERIPMLEDGPKWINITEKGDKLDFIDDYLVKYRLSPNSLSFGLPSRSFYESSRRYYLLYKYPLLYQKDKEAAIDALVNAELKMYDKFKEYYELYYKTQKSYTHIVGKVVLWPVKQIAKLFNK